MPTGLISTLALLTTRAKAQRLLVLAVLLSSSVATLKRTTRAREAMLPELEELVVWLSYSVANPRR
jgi:hypothetical protein